MILSFLEKPYPFYDSLGQRWRLVITISLFIGIFCVVFRPFGLDNLPGIEKYFVAFGFGLVTFIVELINMILLPYWLPGIISEKKWTVGKEVMWVFWMLSTIAAANYFYAIYFYPISGGWVFFAYTLTYTCVIGIIPAIGVIFFKQVYTYKKVIKEVGLMNESLSTQPKINSSGRVILESEGGKDQHTIDPNAILCIESSGNYVEVFYEDGSLKRKVFRNKISTLQEKLIDQKNLVRCHRTYIVNIDFVENISGNSQGYKLRIKYLDIVIPVSRSKSKLFRTLIVSN